MATRSRQPRDRKTERLRQYLREHVAEGKVYFKSKYVAQDLEYSSHEIGALFLKLSEDGGDLDIEQWSYSNGTTWKVTEA